ncbi:agouti-related protein [Protopterus annectens]|uniref:agouti-related protein n=1 Tax=Protopterus annectens TaxID=7888 RepID=UPI001CFB935E|nr:agouti-related protein [Protopterus annectens]
MVTMLNTLLLCWCILHGLQTVLTSDPSNTLHLEELSSNMNRAGRYDYLSQLRKAKQPTYYLSGPIEGPEFDKTGMDSVDEDILQETVSLDHGVLSNNIELQNREERSPRKCLRLSESCLGLQLPCCDPCAACYCRFFTAVCYCKKISSLCPNGKH